MPFEEGLGAVVLGVVDHLCGGALLDDNSVVHEDHPVRDVPGEGDFMADDQHGHSGARELTDYDPADPTVNQLKLHPVLREAIDRFSSAAPKPPEVISLYDVLRIKR